MRALLRDILTGLFMGMVLPGLLVNAAVMLRGSREAPLTETEPAGAVRFPAKVRMGDAVTEMDMDDYITGVVLAEMPASFEPEALKAQSIAARTYTQKAAVTGGKHGDGSVCTVPSCCQGYIAKDSYFGTEEDVEKIADAVAATSGMVLTYEGELIEATYFSCSGGATEDAVAVWGTDFPYLRSVSSPGEEGAAAYSQTLIFTPEELEEALDTDLTGSPENWFTVTTYTEGGGVAAMTIGGQVYSGTQLRSLLGLRSTAFTVNATGTKITITTKGYGHRVGLSQYGADAMAATGSSFDQILAHYYPGTNLSQMEIIENGEQKYK